MYVPAGLGLLLTLVYCGYRTSWWVPIAIAPCAFIGAFAILLPWFRLEARSPTITNASIVVSALLVPLQLVLICVLLATGRIAGG
jgi:hypothetical protein